MSLRLQSWLKSKKALCFRHTDAIIHDKYTASDLTTCDYDSSVPREECINRTCEKCGRVDGHVALFLLLTKMYKLNGSLGN
ncbi:hypothetical protein HOLleu_30124 [Holothuria leucospilota]|uniref:Uncharacterized protein n=1 Tax=Holothuria leucospilota TaxID=206669 RepID=A0A9Q1GYC4_HOLLE|nr:hypothetical protein HOLleu_30124 [Holothuria leucospilota]